jgi:hypothetical protein
MAAVNTFPYLLFSTTNLKRNIDSITKTGEQATIHTRCGTAANSLLINKAKTLSAYHQRNFGCLILRGRKTCQRLSTFCYCALGLINIMRDSYRLCRPLCWCFMWTDLLHSAKLLVISAPRASIDVEETFTATLQNKQDIERLDGILEIFGDILRSSQINFLTRRVHSTLFPSSYPFLNSLLLLQFFQAVHCINNAFQTNS